METQLYSMKNGQFLVFRINRVQPVSSPSATVVAERWGGGRAWQETATAADGTHPTGMHSCVKIN